MAVGLRLCVLFVAVAAASAACDMTKLSACGTTYASAVGSAATDAKTVCPALDTYIKCIPSAAAGCDAAVSGSFSTGLDNMKKSLCADSAAGFCKSESVCTGSSSGGKVVVTSVACNMTKLSACAKTYFSGIARNATDAQTVCPALETYIFCIQSASAGCDAADTSEIDDGYTVFTYSTELDRNKKNLCAEGAGGICKTHLRMGNYGTQHSLCDWGIVTPDAPHSVKDGVRCYCDKPMTSHANLVERPACANTKGGSKCQNIACCGAGGSEQSGTKCPQSLIGGASVQGNYGTSCPAPESQSTAKPDVAHEEKDGVYCFCDNAQKPQCAISTGGGRCKNMQVQKDGSDCSQWGRGGPGSWGERCPAPRAPITTTKKPAVASTTSGAMSASPGTVKTIAISLMGLFNILV